jgi:hypothetical protein
MSYQKNWPTWLAYSVSVVVFLIVAVYAVLYATGYRIDFRDWSLRKTGVLAITTKPAGATLYIDDHKYSRKTPVTLRNMLPGNYTIKLELKDYRMFKKPVEVASSQVTEEHNLDLILENPISKVVATDVAKPLLVGNEVIYFNKDRKLAKLSGDSSTPINSDRLPANVKSVIKSITAINFAKQSDGKTWAMNVTAGGRRWLVIADLQDGYRGQLFGAPLNQATADQFSWIDNDRFMVLMGTTLQLADLNLNKITQYGKNILGASYQNGKLYYITRGMNGSIVLMRDANPFDDRAAEQWLTDLPVAKSYELTAINDDRVILTAVTSAKVKGLWLRETARATDKASIKWTKLASNISEVWYEHHNLKPKLFYTAGKILMERDLVKSTDIELRTFLQPVQLLGKRGESLFLFNNNTLLATDIDGANLYELANITNKTVWLNGDTKKLWILSGTELTELTIRQNDVGIFGSMTNLLPTG